MANESGGKPPNIIFALRHFKILTGVHGSFKTQVLILLRGLCGERVCSWIKMSGLTLWWLGMSSLQSKCIKLVWRTQSTREWDERFMASRRKRWPYWFKPHVKLKLMGGKWRHPVSFGFNGASVLMQMAQLFVLTSSSLQPLTVLHTSSRSRKREEVIFLGTLFPPGGIGWNANPAVKAWLWADWKATRLEAALLR